MKQTLHIFWKDLRHLWIEIFILFAVIAAFAWVYPKRWMGTGYVGNSFPEWSLIVGFLKLFIVLGSWLLIARVIHDESLVGDRQFWLTRPYERKNLLAAKVLFILCFVYAPIFLAQLSILVQAGFHPVSSIPDLLYGLVLLTAVLVLPMMALATVTSDLIRLTLSTLGVCLGLIAFVSAAPAVFGRGIFQNPAQTVDFLSIPTMLSVFTAVIAVQYVTRRVLLSRALLLALIPMLLLYTTISSSAVVINRIYPTPASGEPAPFNISVRQDALKPESPSAVLSRNHVQVYIPIQISSGAENAVWKASGVNVLILGHGVDWNSGWQGMHVAYYRSGQNAAVRFALSRAIFDRVQPVPVTLQLTLALTEARRSSVWTAQVSEHEFAVPGFGICSPLIFPIDSRQIRQISCRSPSHEPKLTLVQTEWSQSTCPAATTATSSWAGNLRSTPAEIGISPVENNVLGFSQIQEPNSKSQNAMPHICPGTLIRFTQYSPVGRFKTKITIERFQFPQYERTP